MIPFSINKNLTDVYLHVNILIISRKHTFFKHTLLARIRKVKDCKRRNVNPIRKLVFIKMLHTTPFRKQQVVFCHLKLAAVKPETSLSAPGCFP